MNVLIYPIKSYLKLSAYTDNAYIPCFRPLIQLLLDSFVRSANIIASFYNNHSMTTSVKKTIFLAGLGLLLLGMGSVIFRQYYHHRVHIKITQSQIDEALRKKFPSSKKYLKIVDVSFTNPQATLIKGTDKVRIGLDANVFIGIGKIGESYKGGATIITKIAYNEKKKQFVLKNAEFERLDIPKIPDKYLEITQELASQVSKEFINAIPVYTLSEKDTKQVVASWLLKELSIKEDVISITLGLPE